MTKNKIWWITQAQIAAGDIDGAITHVDPEQIAEDDIIGLAGAVRLRVENARGPADLYCDPAARTFFRSFHQRWPWAGYFLRLKPITTASSYNQIVDVSVFLALAFCNVDEMTYIRSERGTALRYSEDQFVKQLVELHDRATQLAEAVGLPGDRIRERDALISKSVASFFKLGRALHKGK